jgi:hypothetical protein
LQGDDRPGSPCRSSASGDVDSLHVKIDNLNDPLVGFCFIRSIDLYIEKVNKSLILILERSIVQISGFHVLYEGHIEAAS